MHAEHARNESEAALDHARAVYGRVLAAWAIDYLRLRRGGLTCPCRREVSEEITARGLRSGPSTESSAAPWPRAA